MTGRTILIPIKICETELLVEAVQPAGSEQTSSRLQSAVTESFDRAQDAIVAIATSTVSLVGRLSTDAVRPDEVEVKFGLKFSAQGNVIVAGAAGEATLEVTLTYQRARVGLADAH